jgi:hypothetical protein
MGIQGESFIQSQADPQIRPSKIDRPKNNYSADCLPVPARRARRQPVCRPLFSTLEFWRNFRQLWANTHRSLFFGWSLDGRI